MIKEFLVKLGYLSYLRDLSHSHPNQEKPMQQDLQQIQHSQLKKHEESEAKIPRTNIPSISGKLGKDEDDNL